MRGRRRLEGSIIEVARKCGFDEVRTPIFEHTELFTAKSGDDIIAQLYAFEDKSGRSLTLRPELTAPVMRMVATGDLRERPRPVKVCYTGPCFRYEEAKTGRWREFDQFGVEVVGASGPLVEAEVIACAVSMLEASGLDEWRFSIGHVGLLHAFLDAAQVPSAFTDKQREAAVKAGWTSKDHAGAESDTPRTVLLRMLDKQQMQGTNELMRLLDIEETYITVLDVLDSNNSNKDLGSLAEHFGNLDIDTAPIDSLQETLGHLSALGVPMDRIDLNLTTARGLDYYTGCVFEARVEALGGEGQVLGGGTYRLLHLFGLDDLDPCCGFGFGTDRVLLALERQGTDAAESAPRVALIPLNTGANEVLPMLAEMRDSGIAAEIEMRKRNLSKSMKWANNAGFTHAVVVGPKEIESGVLSVKDMMSGESSSITLSDLINQLLK